MNRPAKAMALIALTLLTACAAGTPRQSDEYNPLGWPAKGLSQAGRWAANREVPLLREFGWLLEALGELTEAPAMLVEGVVTLDSDQLVGSAQQLTVGTGTTLTAAWNVPFFVIPGRNIDLGRDAELVNDALAHIAAKPPEAWRTGDEDPREFIFPPGTRVRASGENLLFRIPGYGEVLQQAQSQVLWNAAQSIAGTDYPAQERSWGFVVRSRDDWNAKHPTQRAQIILHELYHQHMQMRDWLMGWNAIYWPAYIATFPFTGWDGHWAETSGNHAAAAVDRALQDWIPTPESR